MRSRLVRSHNVRLSPNVELLEPVRTLSLALVAPIATTRVPIAMKMRWVRGGSGEVEDGVEFLPRSEERQTGNTPARFGCLKVPL